MNNRFKIILNFVLLFLICDIKSQTFSKETILITTKCGTMKLKLFNETPRHRANFIKLIKQGYYDSLLFHRVINNFVIQGGDPDSKRANDTLLLGDGDVGYWIPSEFNPKLYHKKGALSAPRENDDVNPSKESSGAQFFIVMGKPYDSLALKKAEMRVNKSIITKINYNVAYGNKSPKLKAYYKRLEAEGKTDSLKFARAQLTDSLAFVEYNQTPHHNFSSEQKKTYATLGGTPQLDMNYTVFGQVIEGLEVIDKIAAVKTDKNDRPKENIRMKISIIIDKK